MTALRRHALASLLLLCAMAAGARAQSPIRVGEISSERDCRVYETFWGGWLIVECRNNFAELRTRLQSALAETGRFRLAAGGHVVSGTITELRVTSSSAGGRDYQLNVTRAVASFDLRLRDAGGRTVYAATITRSVEVDSTLSAAGTTSASAASPRAIYAALQREISLAVARTVMVQIDPSRATAAETAAAGAIGAGGPDAGVNRYARVDLPGADDGAQAGSYVEPAPAQPAPPPPSIRHEPPAAARPTAPATARPSHARPAAAGRLAAARVPPARPGQVRLALVIANSDYNLDGRTDSDPRVTEPLGYVDDLRNPANDGAAMRDALERLGFDVTFVEDANRERMVVELGQFGGRIAAAPADTIVIVYYSGHAMEVNGTNFLIPAGAHLTLDEQLTRLPTTQIETILGAHAVPANEILAQLRNPSSRGLNLIVLDACRDNPWAAQVRRRTRSVAARSMLFRGLAEQLPALRNTLIAYSTAPGAAAADGDDAEGSNSPYTGALLRWIERPRLPVRDMLNHVGLEVERTTGQQPYVSNPPIEDICLSGC